MTFDVEIDKLFEPAQNAVAQKRIPCAALGVIAPDGQRFVRASGFAQIEPELVPFDQSMWFDLASLTKVIFTTRRILELIDAGHLNLDEKIATYLPDLRQYDLSAPERALTLRALLSHQTHLPAVEPLYTLGQDAETLRAYVLQRAWKPGPSVYSDINFILLGLVIERVTGKSLSHQPLAEGLSFSPPAEHAVATELCSRRGRVMRGAVHDENAYALGGAAGHAGLFGTVDGVLDHASLIVSGSGLSGELAKAMMTPQFETRTLGWEINHSGWHGGEGHSVHTIGHLGFTGTGLWIDVERGYAWTLLTNRVHPSRHTDTGIMALRRETGRRVAALFSQH